MRKFAPVLGYVAVAGVLLVTHFSSASANTKIQVYIVCALVLASASLISRTVRLKKGDG